MDMKTSRNFFRLSTALFFLFVSLPLLAEDGLPITRSMNSSLLSHAPDTLSFYLYGSKDALEPLLVQSVARDQWRADTDLHNWPLTQARLIHFQTQLGDLDALAVAKSKLWIEMEVDAVSAGERTPLFAEAAGADGLSVEGLIESRSLTTGGFKFPDGSVQTAAVDASCPAGSSIRRLTPDGTVVCETDDVGSGTVTSVTAGAGLSGGTITTSGALSVASAGIGETMLADNAVTSVKIAPGAVGGSELANAAVTPEKLAYPFKASAAVPGIDTNPPEENAVISGINTASAPGSPASRYGLYGQATDSSNSGGSPNDSAGVFGRGFLSYSFGVKGYAGDISGAPHPIGAIGVVGIGQNRGIVGSSASGTGVFASSDSNYGVWGQSTQYRGVTGRTSRADNNYGLYTPDNLYARNYTSTGSSSQVFKYSGDSEILPGDVVSFSGIQMGEQNDDPVVTVNSSTDIPGAAIAGVVASRFNMEAVQEDETAIALDPTPTGPIRPGDYVLVVVRGLAAVNVDASEIQAEPGTMLVSHGESRSIDAMSPAAAAGDRGQTIGILLGELQPATEATGRRSPQVGDQPRKMYVYVSPR